MKTFATISLVLTILVLLSCEAVKDKSDLKNLDYAAFKKEILRIDPAGAADNFFDNGEFTPGIDSLRTLLLRMCNVWDYDMMQLKQISSATREEEKMVKEEIRLLQRNINNLNDFLYPRTKSSTGNCVQRDCPLFAEVIKAKQVLYLYIEGELMDSFDVSTGAPGRETPNMNLKPAGPVFIRYTSRKFPGGDYQGLGNMPYAVFLKGGFAIHGTTYGNISKLGKKASHGCIRLHPDNAKVFFELVKITGLENTWVTVR